MFIRIALAVLFLSALELPAIAQEVITDAGGEFETLLGLRIGQRGVGFVVAGLGDGCTLKSDFHVNRFGDHPVHLILTRHFALAGRCRGRFQIFRQTFTFSYAELGLKLGDLFDVINPTQVNDLPVDPFAPVPRKHKDH